MHIQKIISGIHVLQVQHTETKNNEFRRKKAQQKKMDAMIEEKEKDTDFFIEKMRLKKEKNRLMQKKTLEREKEREEDREEEIDKARLKSKMELDKQYNKTASLRAGKGATPAVTASRLHPLFPLLPSPFSFPTFLPFTSLLSSIPYLIPPFSSVPIFM